MNPQADPNATPNQPGVNQQPPQRPETQLNIPARPSTPVRDYDESAFLVQDDTTTPAPRVLPPSPPRPVMPTPQRSQQQPIVVAAPAPQAAPPLPVTTPTVRPPQSQPVASPPAAIPKPAAIPPTPPPALPIQVPAAPIQTGPIPLPPTQPAAVSLQPAIPTAIPPMPVQAIEPKGTTATTVNYEPTPTTQATSPGPHTDQAIIERIDEAPQQNSRDIEELIEKNHRLHRLKSLASFLAFAGGVIVAAFLINQFVFQSYYVDGTSMTPTLQNDDRLIIDKIERSFSGVQGKPYIPQRGQIIVLDSSIVGFNGREEQLIKRVVGVPGDTVIIKDGTVTIKNKDNPDGFDFNQKFGLNLQPTYVESPQEWLINDSHLFVMGDNRAQNGSYDSRAFGPVETNKIVGRLWARILPFDKAQIY